MSLRINDVVYDELQVSSSCKQELPTVMMLCDDIVADTP
jgi:hypothetical protein